MTKYSTREAAKKLGISHETLAHYVAVGKVPAPEIVTVSRRPVHLWTEPEIEHVRQLLPKIANGRKTRHQKPKEEKEEAQSKAVPRKSRKPKKK